MVTFLTKWMLSAVVLAMLKGGQCNPDVKRLFDDLMNGYNSIIRPVSNNSDRLEVKMGIRLSQLIDVNMKSQILSTNVWVEHEWTDYKLKWEPEEYGGVTKLHVPSEQIWLPDIVLYNNADGNYEITIMTKAILHYDGRVVWKPPAIYKSSCAIDVEYFPFDEQNCFMKFGTWTHDGYTIDLRHINAKGDDPVIEMGMDLSEFYLSVEWDIMAVPARRKVIFYSCCEEPYIDITFSLTLRRKTLFYTFNLIIPCLAISFLSILVFYLPSDSNEKVSLSISIMLSLVVFFLLLAEIIPPTSLTVPLLGKYLLFTMILVTLSVVITIAIQNVNFRSPGTHIMSPWVRKVFIDFLPKFLFMQRPRNDDDLDEDEDGGEPEREGTSTSSNSRDYENGPEEVVPMDEDIEARHVPQTTCKIHGRKMANNSLNGFTKPFELNPVGGGRSMMLGGDMFGADDNIEPAVAISPELMRLTTRIQFLSQHKKNMDSFIQIEEDWKFVAMVLDRLFLWVFTILCIGGAVLIILRAPTLYDSKQPIDVLLSKNIY